MKNILNVCSNCGADRGLHHYQTMQCPVGGREEMREDHKQEWMTKIFEEDNSETRNAIEQLKQQIQKLEKAGMEIFEEKQIIAIERNQLGQEIEQLNKTVEHILSDRKWQIERANKLQQELSETKMEWSKSLRAGVDLTKKYDELLKVAKNYNREFDDDGEAIAAFLKLSEVIAKCEGI